MAVWEDKFIDPNQYSRPQKKITAVKKIVIHWTANYGASAENHYRYFSNLSDRYASAHFFVDKDEALCIIPLNEIAYHANDGSYRGVEELKPNANYLSLGIELCVEKDGSFHDDTIAGAILVAVELCKRYKLNPMTDIVRHYDVTHKSCPTPWVKDSTEFTAFKKAVDARLDANDVKKVEKVKKVVKATVKNTNEKTPNQVVYKRVLKEGMSGSDVKALQVALNFLGHDCGKPDGIFGEDTTKAVKNFQKYKGKGTLTIDGLVGRSTMKKINSLLK